MFVVRRLLFFVGVVFGLIVLTFVLTRILPIDPVRALAGPQATEAQVAGLRHQFGLDKPLIAQFESYIVGIFSGNLGNSLRTGRPVWQDLSQFLPATLELTTFGFIFTLLFGFLMGSLSGIRKNSVVDHALRVFSLFGISMPSFWLGLVAIVVLSLALPIFPAGGRLDFTTTAPPHVTGFYTIDSLIAGNIPLFIQTITHLLLPALVLGFWGAAWMTRHTRSSILEVTKQDYVTMARAKGLSERKIFTRHILRNGLIPPLTIAGLIYGSLISAAIPIELVFSYPGVGLYAFYSSTSNDYNAIVGVALLTGISFSLANLVIDLIYPILDPRIKYE